MFRVACCDKYVVGLSDLGRCFVWHSEAVPELGLPASPNPAVVMRSASVLQVVCLDTMLVALTDTGDVMTWGEYGPALGQGARPGAANFTEAPRRLAALQTTCLRRLAASERHVVALTGDGTSRRDSLVWELFARERQYCRVLYAIVDEYSRRIKIKDTPHLFRNAKLLQDYHTALLRQFCHVLEHRSPAALVELGALYSSCYSLDELGEVYRAWQAETAGPLEKLSRPKLAGQLAEIELEVEAVTKKTDNQLELSKSFSLVSLLREPPRHLQWCLDQLRLILEHTPADHIDASSLPEAIAAMQAATGLPAPTPAPAAATAIVPENRPGTPTSSSSSPSEGPRKVLASSEQGVVAATTTTTTTADEAQQPALPIQERFRFRALQTELDIYRDANAQLVLYAKALEEEALQRPRSGGAPAGSTLPSCLGVCIARSRARAQ